jgi:hypothetical protein
MLNSRPVLICLTWMLLGIAYLIYGKKQGAWVPILGGLFMVAFAWLATVTSIVPVVYLGIMGLVYLFAKEC